MQTQNLHPAHDYLHDKIDFESVRAEKQRIATFFGLAAGAVFAIVTWGYDAFLLARAHAMYPWLAFAIGLAVCALIGSLSGWITYHFNHLVAGFLSWLAAGIAFSWLAGHLSFTLLQQAITALDPTTGQMLSYPMAPGLQARQGLVEVVAIGLSVLAGLLEINLADSTANASAQIGRYFPMLVWAVLFFFTGLAAENNLSAIVRQPVVNLNATIQYALDHPSEPLTSPSNPDFRTGALLDIQSDLSQPRRLILQKYDDDLYNSTVLARFGNSWATCSVSSGQPVYCKPASPADLNK
jgi:hypothetical protein